MQKPTTPRARRSPDRFATAVWVAAALAAGVELAAFLWLDLF